MLNSSNTLNPILYQNSNSQKEIKKEMNFSASHFLTNSLVFLNNQKKKKKEEENNFSKMTNFSKNANVDESNLEIISKSEENSFLIKNLKQNFANQINNICLHTYHSKFLKNEVKNKKDLKKDFQSKLILFGKCSFILTKIFKGQEINFSDLNLEDYEKEIIKNILIKKYFCKKNYFDKDQTLNFYCEKIKKFSSSKRPEENNKFIYKNNLKIMIKNFLKAKNLKKTKENENLFYIYYFEEISKKKNISLKSFYDPLNVKQKVLTLNNKFLNLIFSSKKFKKDFFETLKNDLSIHYEKLIIKKFEKFFWKFEKKRFLIGKKNQITLKLINYLFKSKRVKFPWDNYEITEAIRYFKKRIEGLIGNL